MAGYHLRTSGSIFVQRIRPIGGVLKHLKEVMKIKDSIDNISLDEAKEKLDDPNVQFIDVRDKESFSKGSIGNAINLERGLLEFYLADGSPMQVREFKDLTEREYIVVCNFGRQSVLATKTMKDMGVHNVKNLIGGYAEWQKSNQ